MLVKRTVSRFIDIGIVINFDVIRVDLEGQVHRSISLGKTVKALCIISKARWAHFNVLLHFSPQGGLKSSTETYKESRERSPLKNAVDRTDRGGNLSKMW